MIGLLQRVSEGRVVVEGQVIAEIGRGILVLVGVEKHDGPAQVNRLAERLLGYRVFADEQGRMNLSVRDIDGGVLLVPQFTLAADTRKGTRASFTSAARPQMGRACFEQLVRRIDEQHAGVQSGRFGADMQVSLTNDGPVTFWLQS